MSDFLGLGCEFLTFSQLQDTATLPSYLGTMLRRTVLSYQARTDQAASGT
ncbi:hypothetical protein [Haloferula sp.]